MGRPEQSAVEEELEMLTYAISHDLRAPLRAVVGFSRILVEDHTDALDEEARRVVETIERNAGRLNELITALLDLSRVGRHPLEFTAIDMEDEARRAWRDVTDGLEGAALTIDPLPSVRGDRS